MIVKLIKIMRVLEQTIAYSNKLK